MYIWKYMYVYNISNEYSSHLERKKRLFIWESNMNGNSPGTVLQISSTGGFQCRRLCVAFIVTELKKVK